MPDHLDNDTLNKTIHWLAKAAAKNETLVDADTIKKETGIRDDATLLAAIRYWAAKGAVEKWVPFDNADWRNCSVNWVTPSPIAHDVLIEWKRQQADAAHPDFVSTWQDRTRRHRGGAMLVLFVQIGLPLIGAIGGVLGGLAYFTPPAPVQIVQPATAPTAIITSRQYQVIRVIDGDTFTIAYDGEPTSVRILGIDTPERGQPGYTEATEALRGLIASKTVTITFDDPKGHKRDHFGRLLCQVDVDGVDVGRVMLDRGLAKPHVK